MGETFSLSAFGRLKGVSAEAVSKAVRTHRLNRSVGRDAKGRPVIVDVELAMQEWADNSRRTKPEAPSKPNPLDGNAKAVDLSPFSTITLAEAQRVLTIERTRKLQLERDVAEGRLVSKAVVAKEVFECDRILRENILNIATRIAGQLAAESDPARAQLLLDAALREALNVTADAYEARSTHEQA